MVVVVAIGLHSLSLQGQFTQTHVPFGHIHSPPFMQPHIGVAVGFTDGVTVATGFWLGFALGVAVATGSPVGFALGVAVATGSPVGFVLGVAVAVVAGFSPGFADGVALGVAVATGVVSGFADGVVVGSTVGFGSASSEGSLSFQIFSNSERVISRSFLALPLVI